MRKKTRHYPLIYARYVFPVISNILIIVFAFIPNMRFTLENDVRQSMSLWELIKNTWYNSRMYLFSEQTKQTNDGALFYKAVFITLVICGVLFLIGTLMSAFASLATLRYFKLNDTKLKNIYTAIVPNRFVMLVFSLTLLPITFLPEILVYFYKHLLLYPVSISYSGLSCGIMSLVVTVIMIALTLLSAKTETSLGLNIFYYDKGGEQYLDSDIEKNPEAENSKHYSLNNNKNNDEKIKDLLGLSDSEENEQK